MRPVTGFGSSSAAFFCLGGLVYLLYVDESGSPEKLDDPFVVGALAIRQDAVEVLRRDVESIVAKHLDQHLHRLELHATQLRVGSGSWRGIPLPVRTALLTDILALLARTGPERRLFAVARSPGAVAHVDPLTRVFEELLLRFSSFLKRMDRTSSKRFGLVIADKAKYEQTLQPIVTRWRDEGTRFGPLTRVVEVPLFVDSKATRLTQLADFVAHAVFRYYRSADSTLLTPLLPAFDKTGARLHGLLHLTSTRHACSCPACTTRRPARSS